MIVDLNPVERIDAAIADELVRLRNVLAARGERLAISVRAASETARFLRSRQIDRLIRIFPTIDWALQAA